MGKRYEKSIIVLLLQSISIFSFAQYTCGTASLDSAENKYGIGRFEECIEDLTRCLAAKKGFDADQKIHAYQLLAKSYLAIDSINSADSVIEELLLLKDNFEPDFNDPERFRSHVSLRKSNIISSVSKRNEDIRLAPATSMIITAEEIFQRGYTDLIDMLKDIPGFDISTYYGQLYASVYQRGFRTNNTERILLLIDGVEDNDLWSNFADISQQYPLTNIKRVEVIYGPASTMYGPNAFSGVINIITKEPAEYLQNKKSFGVHANAGVGSYKTGYMDVSVAYKKRSFSFDVTGRIYYSDRPDLSSQRLWDYKDVYDTLGYRFLNINGKENATPYMIDNNLPMQSPWYMVTVNNGDTTQIRLTPEGKDEAIRLNKMLFNINKDADPTRFNNPSQAGYLNARINIGDFSLGLASWAKTEGIGTTYTDAIASVAWSRWRPAHHYVYFKYNKRLNEKLLFTTFLNYKIHTIRNGSKITSIVDYSRFGGLEIKDLQNGIPAHWLTTYYYEQSEQFRSEFKLLYNQGKFFSLISGIELRNSQLQGYYLTDTVTEVPEDHGTIAYSNDTAGNQYNVNDFGIYTQGNYRTKNGLDFTLGARLDYNQIGHGGGLGFSLSPRLVVNYVKKQWVLKAIASRGIQNVSNYTKFNDVNIVPNPNLKPESISNFELSANYRISDAFTADIDFYYSKIKNVVISVPNLPGAQQNINVGEFNVKGVQANLYFRSLDKKWQATVNYSYTNPRQTRDTGSEGKPVIINSKVGDIAAHKANAIVNYVFLKNFNVNLRVNYVGDKKTGEGTTVHPRVTIPFDSYTIFNLTLSIQNIIKNVGLQVTGNNIFNTSYYSPGIRGAGGFRAPDEVLQMSRNFFIRMIYQR